MISNYWLSWIKVATKMVVWSTLLIDGVVVQSQTTHFGNGEIIPVWESFSNEVGYGNGVFLSPNEEVLVVVSSDGLLRAINPLDGSPVWSLPPPPGSTSSSGALFVKNAVPTPYLIYCVKSGVSSERYSTIIGINYLDGTALFATAEIPGECVGTPVATADGRYVMTTHNIGGEVGFFSIYDTINPTVAAYTYQFDAVEAPFGAIGFYWGPGAGYFDGGETNTNDVFIWGLDDNPNVNGSGYGQVFAFQLPLPPTTTFNVTTVGGERDFTSPLPPIITNDGFSMYWSVARSFQRCWNGELGLGRRDFSTNGVNAVGFQRGRPALSAARAPPTLSSDPVMPFVVGPTAANQIFRLSFDFFEDINAPIAVTTGVVSSRILISRDDAIVYYATPAPDGNLVGLDSSSLQQLWNVSIPNGIVGDIALSLNGDTVYLADALGGIRAYTVAEAPPFTPMPTPSPSKQGVLGTFSPAPATMSPGATPTPPPTVSPSAPNFVTLVPTVEALTPTAETLDPTVETPPPVKTSFPPQLDGTLSPAPTFPPEKPPMGAPDGGMGMSMGMGDKKSKGMGDKGGMAMGGKQGMGMGDMGVSTTLRSGSSSRMFYFQ